MSNENCAKTHDKSKSSPDKAEAGKGGLLINGTA
jgi:hypothetical protein